ncbi:hypothetical protein RRG08_050232 [Elysia crispata]|uniref:Uncharacterized protein n=1 Tax=Elysia crispata TaxID=231223 RepID=A0AAE1B584_9GAST|nr:hypothetical protein RRG08_050232 [Elysia crispata]
MRKTSEFNQAAIPPFRSTARGRVRSPPPQPPLWAPPCATANRPTASAACTVQPRVGNKSCKSIYKNKPYFMPAAGYQKKGPARTFLHGRRRKPKDAMFNFAEVQIINDRTFGEWDRRFGNDFCYRGSRRL